MKSTGVYFKKICLRLLKTAIRASKHNKNVLIDPWENSSEGKIILFAVLTQLNLRTSNKNLLDSMFQTSI